MKLVAPTDFEILDALSDRKRNNAANLSYDLEKNRSYINTRLPILADFDLVERVGPAPNSGLYEITDRGMAAVELRDRYAEGDFDERIDARVNK